MRPSFGQESILECIGNTPLLFLREPSLLAGAEIYGKCEFLNPGQSVKDRTALSIIEDAERSGRLGPGGTVIEGTAGNTGIGLAMICAVRGYRCLLLIPETMTPDKIDFVRALGAEVRLVEKKPWGDPQHYTALARQLAEEIPGAIYADQFSNPANTAAHYETTGPEIWAQSDGQVDTFVAGSGTSGTIVGAGRYLKEKDPNVQVIAADPGGSIYHDVIKHGTATSEGSSIVEGVGIGKLPAIFDPSPIDDVIRVDDRDAVAMTHLMLAKEGLFLGGCAGMVVSAAVRWARDNPSTTPKRIVVILTDTGLRYMSRLYNREWLAERDLI